MHAHGTVTTPVIITLFLFATNLMVFAVCAFIRSCFVASISSVGLILSNVVGFIEHLGIERTLNDRQSEVG